MFVSVDGEGVPCVRSEKEREAFNFYVILWQHCKDLDPNVDKEYFQLDDEFSDNLSFEFTPEVMWGKGVPDEDGAKKLKEAHNAAVSRVQRQKYLSELSGAGARSASTQETDANDALGDDALPACLMTVTDEFENRLDGAADKYFYRVFVLVCLCLCSFWWLRCL